MSEPSPAADGSRPIRDAAFWLAELEEDGWTEAAATLRAALPAAPGGGAPDPYEQAARWCEEIRADYLANADRMTQHDCLLRAGVALACAEGIRRRAAAVPPTAAQPCSECHGSGRTDNHVNGETECFHCEGSGDDPSAAQPGERERALEAALRIAMPLLDEVYRTHRDFSSPDYNECDKPGEACQWCAEVDQVRAITGAATPDKGETQ